MASGFLSRLEIRRLQGMYEVWIQTVKSDMIAPRLYSMNLLSKFEYESYQAISTNTEKAGFLFQNVLMKCTYDDLSRIRNFLISTGMQVHIHVAKMMPDRGEVIDFNNYPHDCEMENTSKQSPTRNMNNARPRNGRHHQCSETGNGEENDVDMRDDDEFYKLDLEEDPSSVVTESELAERAGGKMSKAPPNRTKKINRIAKAAANPDYSDYQSGLGCYDTKPKNDKKKGKGLCVIIRNFSEDLQGYRSDAEVIVDFFSQTLNYTVWSGEDHGLVDLTKKAFMQQLQSIQDFLTNKFNSDYDRFFLYVLSHGDEHGIKTCAQGSKRDEELEADGKPVRIPVEDITKMFTHDKVPSLKGYPKCFMIQACQGTEVAKPAATSDKKEYITQQSSPAWEPPRVNIALGADIMVCLPSEKGTYSWVPSTGSWFIQETIAVMRRYFKSEHLVDIMVHVNGVLSQKKGKGKVSENTGIIDVVQMPGLSCSLTSKFFLSIPTNYLQQSTG